MKKTGLFVKTTFLAFSLVVVAVVPVHAQSGLDAFMRGAQMAIEQQRMMNETRMINQQIELMRQQTESMREAGKEYTNALFEKGFQQGFTAGYKKGTEDTVDYIKKTEGEIQVIVFNFVGKELFNETSIDNLIEARKGFYRALNTPNHYVAKVYITLIDARLEELRKQK
jgi:hypothetical protein